MSKKLKIRNAHEHNLKNIHVEIPHNSFTVITGVSGSGLYIFDEPSTGLHMQDVERLLLVFNQLIDRGHSVLVVEHKPEIILASDRIVDLGPEGGDEGGNIIFEGLPEEMINCKQSHTGKALKSLIIS